MTRRHIVPAVETTPTTDASTRTRIDADLLIPGRGDPIEDASLIVKDGKIEFVGKSSQLPMPYRTTSAIKVPILMPGMWDAHVHFMGFDTLKLDDLVTTPQALCGARLARDVAATLNAGFTSVRELAGYGVELSKAISSGWLPGPNIYSSVSPLSITGGHGDAHSLPLSLVHDAIDHGLPFGICDGVESCLKAVRTQVRRGAQVIKVCATGGVLSLLDSPQAPEFSPAELRAIVEEATRTDMIVAAHCHGKRGIMAALHAGVKTIEHGTFLDDEAIALMLEKDAMLIATRSIIEYGVEHPESMTEESYAKLLSTAAAHKEAYAKAVKAGVRIALGTDLGISSLKLRYNHGMNGGEFGYAVEAGLTPLQAIEAGTANAPQTLGPRAPMAGQLKEGYDADVIALSENPLEDIGVLGMPEKVTHVWKSGKLEKGPGRPIGLIR